MPITTEVKTSSANRRASRGTGITGLTLELQLVHLQNIAILRDKMKAFLLAVPMDRGSSEIDLITEAQTILDFIVQEDFQSPIANDLWGYDPNENLSRTAKY